MPHGYGAISFPGLGIYDLEINRVAFSVYGKDIYWYGIIIATGFFLGVMLAARLAKRSGIDPDRIIDLTLIATPVAIIGARAYYVLTTLGEYDSFYEMIAIWNGGIAIYGAILSGLAVVLLYCRIKKLPLMRVLDCLAPAVILGQAIGRWGNFVNQEAFGGPCDLPWRMELVINGEVTAVHPTFLYESLWNILGFVLLLLVFRRKKRDGRVFWSYMGWYGFGRFFIEGLRVDSLYVGQFRISQLVGVAAVAISIIMLLRKNKDAGDGTALEASADGSGSRPMAKIIDGKDISAKIRAELASEVADMEKAPGLAVVLVGDDPASQVYVKNKSKACEEVGITVKEYRLAAETTQQQLEALIAALNANSAINGILVQLPLPKHLDAGPIIEGIDERKDVDAFHPANVGRIMLGSSTFAPCTPAGVMELLERSGVTVEGSECVVVGRSNIVGKPQAMLLMHKNGTITVCHSKTKDLPEVTRRADILIVAIGRPKFITADMVKEGAVVIDVGMNHVDGKLCGDVDFEQVAKKASAITPVPGGVGPMTITMLLKNTITAAKLQQSELRNLAIDKAQKS
ncbi:MAG TPA: bifunctional methylenetetrahydrofolate dehydrogenase/methenyltetrahydrofolate cyclohydrolase FolD [Terriglobales bacterium]|nr:bifunctional methylenetetrahydrofolate dehydrogenase/methenyltetrahydrofolate cyclohydrolase FolD [Terriglobales bacterium]